MTNNKHKIIQQSIAYVGVTYCSKAMAAGDKSENLAVQITQNNTKSINDGKT